MITTFKNELFSYGSEKIIANPPYESQPDINRIDRILDDYSNTWLTIRELLSAKKNELIERSLSFPSIDFSTLPDELENTIVELRKNFTSTYPLKF